MILSRQVSVCRKTEKGRRPVRSDGAGGQGHATTRMTMAVYAHVMDVMDAAAASAIDDALKPKGDG